MWTFDYLADNQALWEAIPAQVKEVLRLSWHSSTDGIVSGHFSNSILRKGFANYHMVIFAHWEGVATLNRGISSVAEAVRELKDHANEMLPYNFIPDDEAEKEKYIPVIEGAAVRVYNGFAYAYKGENQKDIQEWAQKVNQRCPNSILGIIIS